MTNKCGGWGTYLIQCVPMNFRIYLNVPFCDKDYARELGCKWDPDAKKWYCIDSKYWKSNVANCVINWGIDA